MTSNGDSILACLINTEQILMMTNVRKLFIQKLILYVALHVFAAYLC